MSSSFITDTLSKLEKAISYNKGSNKTHEANIGNNTSLISEGAFDGGDKGTSPTIENDGCQKMEMVPQQLLGKQPRAFVNLTDSDEGSGSKKVCPSKTAMVMDNTGWTEKPIVPMGWSQPLIDQKSMVGLQSNLVVCSHEYRRTPTLEVCILAYTKWCV